MVLAHSNLYLVLCRVMQAAIDATDIDRGPIVNSQVEVALYFILFIVIFAFFFLNIFVALIILTFQEEKEKEQGECELERNQVGIAHRSRRYV